MLALDLLSLVLISSTCYICIPVDCRYGGYWPFNGATVCPPFNIAETMILSPICSEYKGYISRVGNELMATLIIPNAG
ncbi:hypothetical protein LENED_008079 [Lentinula edodes]|uniref:Secreted protein n=1 Tax=Lentinula edodes TaxID=5353 RepID=A0A1Q3EG67_LENED|nr:hypothetical protein LENED_008079 [Lentinula edodes]